LAQAAQPPPPGDGPATQVINRITDPTAPPGDGPATQVISRITNPATDPTAHPGIPRPRTRPEAGWREFATGEEAPVATAARSAPANLRPANLRPANLRPANLRPANARPPNADPGGAPLGTGAPLATGGAPADLAADVTGLPASVRRLRLLTSLSVILALIGAVPAALVIREATRDPVLIALESLDLPAPVARRNRDASFGNRWCLRQCRSRERTWDSERGVEDTAPAYQRALRDAGWRPWLAPGCPPEGIDGHGSCWQRDEYVLNLYVRAAACPGRPGGAPAAGVPAPGSPTLPGGPAAPAPPSTSGAPSCPAALATVKVFNRVSFRGGPG
jgi:hypothetical protein